MKKYGIFKVILLMLALILTVSTAVSCALPLLMSDGSETNATETTPQSTTAPGGPGNEPQEEKFQLKVLNGTLPGGVTEQSFAADETVILSAASAPKGYAFSHWENSKGEQVSLKKQFTVTVSANETYKAYYDVNFSTAFSGLVLNDIKGDWQQGGFDDSFKNFKVGEVADPSRVCLMEPFLLPKGATIDVTLPLAHDNEEDCPWDVDNNDATKKPCKGECHLAVGWTLLDKNTGSDTGVLMTDYKIKSSGYVNDVYSYTAIEDTYLMFTVKYSQHGSYDFKVNDIRMKDIAILYSAPKTEEGSPVGSYWVDELDDSIKKIEDIRADEGTSSYLSEFFYITDTHWIQNAQYSPSLINYLAEKLEAHNVVFGGDLIYRYNENKESAIRDEIQSFYTAMEGVTKVGEKLKIFTTLGNHDRNGSSGNTNNALRLTEAEAYELYLKRVESFGVTTKDNPNHSYYDDTANKVRYVQFYFAGSQYGMLEDTYVDAAMQWAEEKIDELDESWTVVLFTHGYFCGSLGRDNEVTPESDRIGREVLRIKAEAKADLAVWIVGHNHEDRSVELVSSDGNTKLRLLSLNTDAYSHSNTKGSYKMKLGTVSEQSFSFFQIDTLNKNIYLTRVGVGTDAVYSYGEPEDVVDDGNGPNSDDGTVNIRVTGGALADGATSAVVEKDTEITLTAAETPEGYLFKGWRNAFGEIISTESTLTLSATENEIYKATFIPIKEATVEVVGGTLADGTTKTTVAVDYDMITLIAGESPEPGVLLFDRWVNYLGETVGTTETLTLVATGTELYTAVFEPAYHDITVVDGTFEDGYTIAHAEKGETVTLIANPANPGYTFSAWINSAGEKVGMTATLQYTVENSDTLTATYVRADGTYAITVVDGLIDNEHSIGAYLPGTVITLQPVAPSADEKFAYWKNSAGETFLDAQLTVTVEEKEETYTAEFVAIERVYVIIENGKLANGTTAGAPAIGDTITMTANAAPAHYRFSHWENLEGDVLGTDATLVCQATVTEVYRAVYTMKITTAINGTITAINDNNDETNVDGSNKAQTAVDDLTATVTMKANIAPAGYKFVCWKDADGNIIGELDTDTNTYPSEITVTADADATYKACYEIYFGEPPINTVVITNSSWKQGGMTDDAVFTVASAPEKYRCVYLLYKVEAGETFTVKLPASVACPFLTTVPANCDNKGLTCTLDISYAFGTVSDETNPTIENFTASSFTGWETAEGCTINAATTGYALISVKYTNHPTTTNIMKLDNATYGAKVKAILDTFEYSKKLSNVERPIGNYWTPELEDSITKIENNRNTIGAGISEFFYLNDITWNDNTKHSPTLINYIAGRVDAYDVVVNGNILTTYYEDKADAIEEIEAFYDALTSYTDSGEALRILTTMGENDRNYSADDAKLKQYFKDKQAYNLFMARMEAYEDAMTVANNPYNSYMDDTDGKVRYIQFYYTGDRDSLVEDAVYEASLAWVEEKVKELDADWTVVLFTHALFGETNTAASVDLANRMMALQAEADAEIAAWITGHNNEDKTEVLMSADGQVKLPLISLRSDCCNASGDSNEQSFNFIQIDTANQEIYITRIGAGDDMIVKYGQDVEGTLQSGS